MGDDFVKQLKAMEQMHVPLKMDTPFILSRKTTPLKMVVWREYGS